MLKPQIEKKAKIVEDIQERVSKAQIGILADFTGLKVESMTLLRRQVKEAGGELKVAKNTLLKRAAGEGNLIEPIREDLVGPNALVLGYEDPVALAKILIKFAQDMPLLKIKGGVMGGQPLTVQEVDALSKLPVREVLLAQLLGLIQATPQRLVTVLSGVIRNFLNVLVALRDQKGGEEAPAAAAASVEEAPAAAAESGEAEAPAAEAESAGEEAPAAELESTGEEAPAVAAEGDGEAPAAAAETSRKKKAMPAAESGEGEAKAEAAESSEGETSATEAKGGDSES
jgi:large subunit ribosomal protein L10